LPPTSSSDLAVTPRTTHRFAEAWSLNEANGASVDVSRETVGPQANLQLND
jgi:hypothetical protein